MPNQVLLTKVELLKIERSKKGNAGKAKFRAALTKPISKLLEWEPVPENELMCKPGGELAAKNMVLRNAKGDLAQYTIGVDIQSVGKFEIHRHEKEGTRGKGTTLSLEFWTTFVDIKGCAVLESYMVVAADSKGTLTVEYSPASKQVDMTEVTNTDKQGKLPGADADADDDEDDEDEDDD